MAERCVGLLRGVNVGRAKRIAMADLRAVVAGLGHRDVTTLLNSGNVIFTASGRGGRAAAATRIEQALEKELGVSSRVTLLTASCLETITSENPLGHIADNPSRLLVTVFTRPPDRTRLEPLAARSWAPAVMGLGSRAAYAWCPDGISQSDLPLAILRVLGDEGTARNWATITKLLALVRAA